MDENKQLIFKSIGQYRINKGKKVFIVSNPIQCTDFKWILYKDVMIDGEKYDVCAVERFAHFPPWYKDEPIGLLVRKNGRWPDI